MKLKDESLSTEKTKGSDIIMKIIFRHALQPQTYLGVYVAMQTSCTRP